MKSHLKVIGALVLTLVLGLQTNGHTIPTLQLYDGSNTITVEDNGPGDRSSLEGVVVFIGPIGVWTVNVSTGLTKPVLGSPSLPWMDLNSIDLFKSNADGRLTISFSEDDYSGGTGNMNMIFQAGGTTRGTVSFQAKVDLDNELFGGDDPFSNLPNSGSYSNGAFSGTSFTSYNKPDNNYSLTIVTDIVHTRAGSTSFNAELKPVPEPTSMILLGLGLLGICLATRKK